MRSPNERCGTFRMYKQLTTAKKIALRSTCSELVHKEIRQSTRRLKTLKYAKGRETAAAACGRG